MRPIFISLFTTAILLEVACHSQVPESGNSAKVDQADATLLESARDHLGTNDLLELRETALTQDTLLTEAIGQMEGLREILDNRRRSFVHLGTALNEIHVPQHRCSILARLLGRTEATNNIEIDYSAVRDGQTGTSDYDLAVAVLSIDNWLINARTILDMPREARVRVWNLDCVGQQSIPQSAYISNTVTETFYSLERDGRILRVLGNVEEGFSTRLENALAAAPSVRVVALGSAGGSVGEALAAGLNIRRRGLDTVLWNECLSACTLVFLGGVERQIWSPYPRLGFHRVSGTNGAAVALDEPVYGRIAEYAEMLGVDSGLVLDAMFAAGPLEMNYPDAEYLCSASIITWMQRVAVDC
jgi:hypothetical protein